MVHAPSCQFDDADDLNGDNLGGEVEGDETFIAGEVHRQSMHKAAREAMPMRGRNTGNKSSVIRMLERRTDKKTSRVRATSAASQSTDST